MDNNKTTLSFDRKQILSLLSSTMYKGDIVPIAVKELLQNSFDATKNQEDGRIDFWFDRTENSITCIDNGVGMSESQVRNVFLCIGGTDKSDLSLAERSGGLGVAKVQFFMAASHIFLETTKSGWTTTLDATQEELLESGATVRSKYTGLRSGTIVQLTYPRTVTSYDGEKSISAGDGYWAGIFNKPLLGSRVQVYKGFGSSKDGYANDRACCAPHIDGQQDYDFPWGKVQVLFDLSELSLSSRWSREAQVFSSGLWQFEHEFRNSLNEGLKFKAYINILPKVAAGQDGYPFNISREAFNSSVSSDLKKIGKQLHGLQNEILNELIEQSFKSFTDLSYISVDGHLREHLSESYKAPEVKLSPEALMAILEAFKKHPEAFANKEKRETKVDVGGVTKGLKLKNNTTGLYAGGEEFFSKIASVVKDFCEELPDGFKSHKDYPDTFGVILDKKVQGINISANGAKGIFVNPLSCSSDMEKWSAHMWHTMLHEATHILQSNHWDSFCMTLHDLDVDMCPVREKYMGKLRTIYTDYCDLLRQLEAELHTSRAIDQ